MKTRVGKEICCVATKIKRYIGNIAVENELDEFSSTNGYIIGYIAKSDKPVYQKDLEVQFGITRSTASKVLTLMEKKDLIKRVSVESDARLKQIILTDKAIMLHNKIKNEMNKFEQNILRDFSDEEIITFTQLLKKLEKNIMDKEVDDND